MRAEGTIYAESYVAVVFYTHWRPMVLVIMLLSSIEMQYMQRIQCVYMIRCDTILLSPNIEGMQCHKSVWELQFLLCACIADLRLLTINWILTSILLNISSHFLQGSKILGFQLAFWPTGQVRMKSYLPSRKIWLFRVIGQHLFWALPKNYFLLLPKSISSLRVKSLSSGHQE